MRIPPRCVVLAFTVAGALAVAAPAVAQGTLGDYERAMGLAERYAGLDVDVAEVPVWIDDTSRFWYRKSVRDGHVFVRVDATTSEQGPAFDHARLAVELAAALDEEVTAATLPFNRITFADDETAIEFAIANIVWRCSLDDYACQSTARVARRDWLAPRQPDTAARPSPDGQWEAFINNYNVVVRAPGSAALIRLSLDGSEGDAYELTSIAWSPDSARLAAYRVQPGYRREVHYVESAPEDQLQPKHSTRIYAKPGDRLDKEMPVVFDVAARTAMPVDDALFPNAYSLSRLVWREDSSALTFEYNQRGHQLYRVVEVDASTGTARVVIDEAAKTFFHYSGKRFRHDIDDGERAIWMSERDGWNHLYMFDAAGAVRHQITAGEWPVREVLAVDEDLERIWFTASGMNAGEDPYFTHLYRVNFDGSGLTPLTAPGTNHDVVLSPDRQFFVDLYSRVDLPPVLELRRLEDAELVAELERADITELVAAGWEAPEVFTSTGRDGATDIWGLIFRPTDFDPDREYPVVEYIYAGPHDSFVPKTFRAFRQMREIAEIGFIVVQIDGMGTSNRSKAFHDVAWMDLKDAGFADRILWHQAVAARYAWYDIDRVGIYGTSAGGQSSLGGLLFHPDFYDVAVSAVGCHDNRMDKIWWNEQWMGWPIGPQYSASSNVDNAWRLQGDVLLIVGELDTNVDPASTMQVVDALIEADKPFDLLVIPGANHTSGGEYGQHKRIDFFVEHLLEVRPPRWADLAAALGTADPES
jgi:dipeptidyl aminopeptidase/acylaminoacyl peptidase